MQNWVERLDKALPRWIFFAGWAVLVGWIFNSLGPCDARLQRQARRRENDAACDEVRVLPDISRLV
jgi:hypothetical protein